MPISFIQLTESTTLDNIYVNPNFIFSINYEPAYKEEDSYTVIISSGDALLNVKETPEQILSLINPPTYYVAGE